MPSFNQSMHPRNPYKQRPDFADLAAQYTPLQPFVIPSAYKNDRVTIDFGNPDALRTLTQALLKCHWNLEVHLPADRLIPAVPQRLNYILWLEDLIEHLIDIDRSNNQQQIRGIDIGTGASCVFPLLICRRNPSWHMLALESDSISAQVALRNISTNHLAQRISLVNTGDCLSHLRPEKLRDKASANTDDASHFHFIICNPPFFMCNSTSDSIDEFNEIQMQEHDDSEGISDLNDDSRSPLSDKIATRSTCETRHAGRRRNHKSQRCKSTGNTSCDNDSITQGGEVQFVRRLIAQSVLVADSIDLFTVMLGCKDSLIALKRELTKLRAENDGLSFNWTLFCQGRVVRWGLVWSFTKNLQSPSVERICAHKVSKKSSELVVHLPCDRIPPGLDLISAWTDILVDTLIHCLDIKTFHITKLTPHTSVIIIKSNVNTWSHQRRKRRQFQRERHQMEAASSPTNQLNGHQSHSQHVEDTQQDEMVIETIEGTSASGEKERESSEPIDDSLPSHSSVETLECISSRQLMPLSSDGGTSLFIQSSSCKRKVDEINSMHCQTNCSTAGDSPGLEEGPLDRRREKNEAAKVSPQGGGHSPPVKMSLYPCKTRDEDGNYLAPPPECECPAAGASPNVSPVASHPTSVSPFAASSSNDQSNKKSRDTNSRQSIGAVCEKSRSAAKWVKLSKHNTFSVQNEKADDIRYLLHCTAKIVKAIDSSVKLIVVNNERSLHHESTYQLFQYLKNRLLISPCGK